MIRVAVPLFGDQVAPRFGFADRFLIADIEKGEVVGESKYEANSPRDSKRRAERLLVELRILEVKVILYGGFDQHCVPLAASKGIHMIDGVRGDPHRAIEWFSDGGVVPSVCCRA